MTDAYARAGVDVGAADAAIGALVGVLRTIDTGRPSRVVPLPGHYAAVLEVAPGLGIAVGTDGVGSKLIVAERTGRYDTVGIDCIAMNVNDVVCVGAEPFAVLDYLAVEQTDPVVFEAIARGLKAGAEQAGVEIPGGEVAVLPELIRGHPSPTGFDLTAACFGTVALDAIVTGADCAPGDALIGLPSSGLHSNGYTLARRVLEPLGLDATPDAARRRVGGRRAARADGDLRPRGARPAAVGAAGARARAHHRRRAREPAAAVRPGRLRDRGAAPGPAGLRAAARQRARGRAVERLQHGLRVRRGRAGAPPRTTAVALLAAHHPGAARVGSVTAAAGAVGVPPLGVAL